MDKWNASLDQSVNRVLLEFQGNQDFWVKLERKVRAYFFFFFFKMMIVLGPIIY